MTRILETAIEVFALIAFIFAVVTVIAVPVLWLRQETRKINRYEDD